MAGKYSFRTKALFYFAKRIPAEVKERLHGKRRPRMFQRIVKIPSLIVQIWTARMPMSFQQVCPLAPTYNSSEPSHLDTSRIPLATVTLGALACRETSSGRADVLWSQVRSLEKGSRLLQRIRALG